MNAKLEAVHPVLMARKVAASITFFQRLGFRPVFLDDAEDPHYAVIRRDGVELHLQWADPSQWAYPTDRPVYRLLVDLVDALFEEVRSSGVTQMRTEHTSPYAAPKPTPWGTYEFHVRDLDGNGLQFYQSL